MKKGKLRTLWSLFVSFFKVGILTFGGGTAMIPMIQSEVVEKRKWISLEDMLNIIAVAEATPGPIAIDAATYVGYQVSGVLGAICATLGAALPSFIIILVISFFYEAFMSVTVIYNAFQGLRVAVILLLIIAIVTLSKAIPRNWVSLVLFIIGFVGMTVLTWFDLTFSFISICFIVLGIIVGVVWEALKVRKEKKKK